MCRSIRDNLIDLSFVFQGLFTRQHAGLGQEETDNMTDVGAEDTAV